VWRWKVVTGYFKNFKKLLGEPKSPKRLRRRYLMAGHPLGEKDGLIIELIG
jgi:hypothetical protein